MENEGISIIICCYNSEKVIAETLKHIFRQEVDRYIDWEVILVNNNSVDNTAQIAVETEASCPYSVPFKIIDQPIPGKANALKKGLDVAQYEYILICDDDNLLDKSYVQVSYKIMKNNPDVGCLGGCGTGRTEGNLPAWFEDFKIYYACGEQSNDGHDITYEQKYVYGAGSVIRKSIFRKLNEEDYLKVLPGRNEKNLVGGEDNLISYIAVIAGYKIWYSDRLKFIHVIDQERLKWDYLTNLSYTNGRAQIYLDPFTEFIKDKEQYKGFIEKITVNIKHILSLLKSEGLELLKNVEGSRNSLLFYYYLGKIKELLKLNFSYKREYSESIEYCRFVENLKREPINSTKS